MWLEHHCFSCQEAPFLGEDAVSSPWSVCPKGCSQRQCAGGSTGSRADQRQHLALMQPIWPAHTPMATKQPSTRDVRVFYISLKGGLIFPGHPSGLCLWWGLTGWPLSLTFLSVFLNVWWRYQYRHHWWTAAHPIAIHPLITAAMQDFLMISSRSNPAQAGEELPSAGTIVSAWRLSCTGLFSVSPSIWLWTAMCVRDKHAPMHKGRKFIRESLISHGKKH